MLPCLQYSRNFSAGIWTMEISKMECSIHFFRTCSIINKCFLVVDFKPNKYICIINSEYSEWNILIFTKFKHCVKIGICCSPLRTQHEGKRANAGWLGFRIMCPSAVACLSVDCCFSGLALWTSN